VKSPGCRSVAAFADFFPDLELSRPLTGFFASGSNDQYQARFSSPWESSMARFFFHLKSGGELMADEEGIDLPGLTEATREALQSARELLAEAIKTASPTVPEAVVVVDETGQPLLELPLVEVLPESLISQFRGTPR
jgi:hypothetical protein